MSTLKTATIARNGRPIPARKPPPELVPPCRYCVRAEHEASIARRDIEGMRTREARAVGEAERLRADNLDLRRRLEVIRQAAVKSEGELRRVVMRLASVEHGV